MLDIKEFATKHALGRSEIAEILDSSIHTVNSWFSGSRNMSKTKEKALIHYIENNL